MEWWQCFVGAGVFACLILIVRVLQKDTIYLAQEMRHAPASVMGRALTTFVFQFVLWGAVIGTPVWFGYRLLF